MNIRIIDDELSLIPYFPNEDVTLEWYQDKELCKQVDNIDGVYSRERLTAMYTYLSTHGDCYYISYRGVLVGDVTLKDDGEVSIVVCREYQNRHIGRKCVRELIRAASEKGLTQITARIYSFNAQSRRMFESVGFVRRDDELYSYAPV